MLPNGYWDTAPRALRLQEAGAGLYAADAERATAGELRALLERVLTEPSFARATARLRAEMLGTPAPADVVRVLERLVADRAAL